MDSLGLVNFIHQLEPYFPESLGLNLYDLLIDEQEKTVEDGLSIAYFSRLIYSELKSLNVMCLQEECVST